MDIVLPPDFKEFLNLLKDKNIKYLFDEIDGIEVNIINLKQLR